MKVFSFAILAAAAAASASASAVASLRGSDDDEQMKHDLKINDIGVGVNLLDEADAPADGFRLDFTHRDRGNTDVNVGEGEANGFLLAASASGAGEDRLLSVPFKNAETETKTKNGHRGTTTSDVGEGEDRLLSVPVPVKNAETETSNLGHRRRTTGEADKAGKASPSNFYEGGLKRRREHQCDSMAPFEGTFVYQAGCDGNPWEVKITCNKKGRNKDRRSGVTCSYFEENLNEDSGKCPYLGNFISKEALSTDGQGNCLLGPITLHPVATVDDEDCDDNHPKLDVKIMSVNKDELKIYFSNDGGKTYYNEEDPRIALRVPDAADADGTNSSGGSSSKGGKKGTNDRRRKLVEAKAQLRRKMEGECGYDRGESCGEGHYWVCGWDLHCDQWTIPNPIKNEPYGDKKCYAYKYEPGDVCGMKASAKCIATFATGPNARKPFFMNLYCTDHDNGICVNTVYDVGWDCGEYNYCVGGLQCIEGKCAWP